jgi:hypothetical protein
MNKMASVIENFPKFDVHWVVRFLQTEGVSQSKVYCRLLSVYGQNIFS